MRGGLGPHRPPALSQRAGVAALRVVEPVLDRGGGPGGAGPAVGREPLVADDLGRTGETAQRRVPQGREVQRQLRGAGRVRARRRLARTGVLDQAIAVSVQRQAERQRALDVRPDGGDEIAVAAPGEVACHQQQVERRRASTEPGEFPRCT